MDSVTLIRVIAGCLALCVLVVALVYIAFLSGVLRKCSPSSRTMQPGLAPVDSPFQLCMELSSGLRAS